jgi:hypothetical protein
MLQNISGEKLEGTKENDYLEDFSASTELTQMPEKNSFGRFPKATALLLKLHLRNFFI